MPVAGHEEGGSSLDRSGKEMIVVGIIGDCTDLLVRRHHVGDQLQRVPQFLCRDPHSVQLLGRVHLAGLLDCLAKPFHPVRDPRRQGMPPLRRVGHCGNDRRFLETAVELLGLDAPQPVEHHLAAPVALGNHVRADVLERVARQLVVLDEQDRTRWDQMKIKEGTAILDEALALRDPGHYQVQAAISALHAEALTPEATDWRQIAMLYETLARMTPSMVVEVNRAVAVGMAEGTEVGLRMLLQLENHADGFYPYHAARADLLRRTNQREAAADAYQRAIDLCSNSAERAYLQRRLEEIQ